VEIELSAFLRLLGSRDAYRRLYQMRAEPVPVLEMLYRHGDTPRSVRRCLAECLRLLGPENRDSPGEMRARAALRDIVGWVDSVDWAGFFARGTGGEPGTLPDPERAKELTVLLHGIMTRTSAVHEVLTDGFINHQLALE